MCGSGHDCSILPGIVWSDNTAPLAGSVAIIPETASEREVAIMPDSTDAVFVSCCIVASIGLCQAAGAAAHLRLERCEAGSVSRNDATVAKGISGVPWRSWRLGEKRGRVRDPALVTRDPRSHDRRQAFRFLLFFGFGGFRILLSSASSSSGAGSASLNRAGNSSISRVT